MRTFVTLTIHNPNYSQLSEETLDDHSLDEFDKEHRRKSNANLTSRFLKAKRGKYNFWQILRLRETFRSTIRDATKSGKVRDMVRYVKRPRSAIERHAFKDASRRHSVVDQSKAGVDILKRAFVNILKSRTPYIFVHMLQIPKIRQKGVSPGFVI